VTQPVDPALLAQLGQGYGVDVQAPAAPVAAPAQAPAAAQLEQAGVVPMRTTAGQTVTVPVEQAGLAMRNRGWTPLSGEQYTRALQLDYMGRDTTQQVLTGLEGGLRGVSAGLSDPLLIALDPSQREDMALRKEANPWIAGGTEIGAGLATAIATGGASAGGLAGRGAAAGFTRYGGKTLLSRAAARVAPGLVEGAVDGAIQGVGGAISEASLANKELTGEQIAMAIGVGGLLGGGIGGALKVPGAARAEVARLLERGGAGELAEGLASKAAALRTSIGDVTGARTEGLIGKLDSLVADQKGWLEKVRQEAAVSGAGGLKAGQKDFMALAEKNPAAAKRALDMLTDEIPAAAKGEVGLAVGADRKVSLEAAKKIEKSQFKRHAGIIDELDELAPEKVDVSEVVQGLRDEAAAQGVGKRSQRRKLLDMAKEIEDRHAIWGTDAKGNRIMVEPPRMSHREMFDARRAWDQKGWDLSKQLKGDMADTHRKARDVMETFFERKADEASARSGRDLSERWQQVKTDVAAMSNVKKWLESGVAGDLANRKMGLSEQFGLVSGMMAGSSVLGPIGGLVGGLIGTAANRVVKMRGNQAIAAMTTRLARGESVATVATGVRQAISAEIKDALGKVPGGKRLTAALSDVGGTAGKVAEGETVKASIDALRGARDTAKAAGAKALNVGRGIATVGGSASKGVLWYGERKLGAYLALRDKAHAAANGDGDQQTIARLTGSSHPDLAEALKAQQERSAAVLARVMPPSEPEQDIRGARPPKAVPMSAIRDATRTVDVIEDPRVVIRGIKNGSIRPSDAATLREVYPEQHAMIVESILDDAHGRDIPAAKRRALSILLDAPVDASTSAPYLAAMVEGLADAPIDEPQPQIRPRQRPVKAQNIGTRAFDVSKGGA